ncbi:MAG: DUF3410 domain-containing protein [Kiritimatiellae bacterium]|nr:DUF3410 domain-containing protein [Kiritimatiellia bacterium]
MKIVCASSILYGTETFSPLGNVVVIPDQDVSSEHIQNANILIVRSKTKINQSLLKDSAIKFVGTATAGTDHMDIPYLNDSGIAWSAAPGCNANSVAEYIITALLCLSDRGKTGLSKQTLGVIGVGEVGSRVVRKSQDLGMQVLACDPPKSEKTNNPDFLALEEVLCQSDIITLHVPLTRAGLYPTFRMAHEEFFKKAKPGSTFINTSRGEVVDEEALLLALQRQHIQNAVLDVWDHEPTINKTLLEHVDIGTPHTAGLSFDGKLSGTIMVYRKACEFLGINHVGDPTPSIDPREMIKKNTLNINEPETVWEIVRMAYDIEKEDHRLRSNIKSFAHLRSDQLLRNEFSTFKVRMQNADRTLTEKVKALGFEIQ